MHGGSPLPAQVLSTLGGRIGGVVVGAGPMRWTSSRIGPAHWRWETGG
jgi:hypothetical protein